MSSSVHPEDIAGLGAHINNNGAPAAMNN